MKTTQVRAIEMDPGDALFFHSNTLHTSGPNYSDHSRNVLLSCYNRADNAPYKSGPNISHTAIVKIPDEDLARYQGKPLDRDGRSFYKPIVAAG